MDAPASIDVQTTVKNQSGLHHLSLDACERLWWMAMGGINQGLYQDAQIILDALLHDGRLKAHANAASAFLMWRNLRSIKAVALLTSIVAGNNEASSVAQVFLCFIYFQTNFRKRALEKALPLVSSNDPWVLSLCRRLAQQAAADQQANSKQ